MQPDQDITKLVNKVSDLVTELQQDVEEARTIAKKALSLLREMPVGLDELDPSFYNLPDWTEE